MLLEWWGDKNLPQRQTFLQSVFLFRGATHGELVRLAQQILEKQYPPGEMLFTQGDVGRACYIVAEGLVEVIREGTDGLPEFVGRFGPGEFFGEMSLLDELPRTATAKAVRPTRLFILYKTHFDHLVSGNPRLGIRVLDNLSRLLSARLRNQSSVASGRQEVASS